MYTVAGEDYIRKSVRRMYMLQRYIQSDNFAADVPKACISSFPLWRYMGDLQREPKAAGSDEEGEESGGEFQYVSNPANLKGIERAHKGFLEERRGISKSKDA